MDTIQELEAQRDALLAEMKSIRSMRRGTISEQYLRVFLKGQKQPAKRGPYYVFSRHDTGQKQTLSRRLSTPRELEEARRDVAARKKFVTLCQEFERLTERLGELERVPVELAEEKKRRRWPSRRTGR
jgi:hypothetical protein